MYPSTTQVQSPYVFQVTAQPTISSELLGGGVPTSDVKNLQLPAALQPNLPGVNDTTSAGTSAVDDEVPEHCTAETTYLKLIVR